MCLSSREEIMVQCLFPIEYPSVPIPCIKQAVECDEGFGMRLEQHIGERKGSECASPVDGFSFSTTNQNSKKGHVRIVRDITEMTAII